MSLWLDLRRRWRRPVTVPDALWRGVLAEHPFIAGRSSADRERLRALCAHFLAEKEFHGANDLRVTDSMALAIAAQACLPLHGMSLPGGRAPGHDHQLLAWYEDFVGVVVQPGAVLARRSVRDATGVVHDYTETLAGEAMDGGPLMLSWDEVARAGELAALGHNVVIHEFVHKMDMHDSVLGDHPDGAPPLPRGFLGTHRPADAAQRWRDTMREAHDRFREAVSLAERFGVEAPWLDSYAAQDAAEFFAVTSEAYFVNRPRFATEFPDLMPLYDGFYFSASAAP